MTYGDAELMQARREKEGEKGGIGLAHLVRINGFKVNMTQ